MNKEHIDRLLEAGLENYSRVEPRPGFEQRFAERVEEEAAGEGQRTGLGGWLRRWYIVAPIPLAAALALAFLVLPNNPDPEAPARVRAAIPPANLVVSELRQPEQAMARARRPAAAPVRRGVHVLSAEELANLHIPEGLLAPFRERTEIQPVVIPELKIPPLESGTNEPADSKSDQAR